MKAEKKKVSVGVWQLLDPREKISRLCHMVGYLADELKLDFLTGQLVFFLARLENIS